MIKQILDLLTSMNHFNQSEEIEIAKGKYEIPMTINKGLKQIKRIAKWQRP